MVGIRSTMVSVVMVALVILSALLLMLSHKANAAIPNFGSIINVNDQKFGSMAASGGNIFLLWSTGKTLSDGGVVGTDVFLRKIKGDGSLLGSVINLRSVDVNIENRMISNIDLAVYGNNVYVTWLEADIPSENYAPKFDIFIRVSYDNGLTFSDLINLTNTGSVQWNYEILASHNNVYVTWIDSSLGNYEVFFRASSGNGATWNPAINLSKNTGASAVQGQSIAVSGNNVYVVWQDTTPGQVGLLFRKSMDNGASFDSTINLGKKSLSYSPAIAAFGNNVYVAGLSDPTPTDDSSGPELNFVASKDNGDSFGNAVNLSKRAGFPTMAAYGSNVYVKWHEIQGTSGPWQIFFSRSADNGGSFYSAIDLSGKIYTQLSSEMAVYSSYVFVTWGEGSNVIFRASSDSGASFQSKVNLSNGQALTGPAMHMSEEKLYVAWISSNGMSFRVASLPSVTIEEPIPTTPVVTITSISNSDPRWDLDTVTISGTISGATESDIITVEWGDGTSNTSVQYSGGVWGPTNHTYDSNHVGVYQVVAKVLDKFGKLTASSSSYTISVKKHATSISISPISSVTLDRDITVTGSLVDAETAVGLGGKVITFNGTGAAGLPNTITSSSGSFLSIGKLPDVDSADLTLQAHFAGDEIYFGSKSSILNYDANNIVVVSTKRIGVSDVAIVAETGDKLDKTAIGKHISIQGTLTNKDLIEQRFIYIVQIKDDNGYAIFLSWVMGTLNKSQSMNPAITWMPDAPSNYAIEIFVWESMTNPQPLSQVVKINLPVS